MSLDRELWHRARALFDELVDLHPEPRRVRLRQLGGDDPVLAAAVERMLIADSSSESVLDEYRFGSPIGTLSSAAAVPMAPARFTDTLPDATRAPARLEPVTPRDVLNLVGQIIAHFRVVEPLAAGGMGIVYRAIDTHLERPVALKFPVIGVRMEHDVRERFLREARAAGAVDHPNICSIYEAGETSDGQLFLAMPLYTGDTLNARIAREGALRIDDAVDVALQMGRGLHAAHRAGIVHRDLKPANVMLLPDGGVKILDFGVALVSDVSLTDSRAVRGTLPYMAPEQVLDDQLDSRADLWALGVCLYEMLTGQRPFTGEHEIAVAHAIVQANLDAPSLLRTEIPPDLEQLVLRLLAKRPENRPESAATVVAALTRIQLRSGSADASSWLLDARLNVPTPAGDEASLARRSTADEEAYDLYLRGRHNWRTRAREGLERAVRYYEQSIERDPSFAAAHAALAETYVNLSNFGHLPARLALARARLAAERAVQLDSRAPETYASLGFVLASDLEFEASETAFLRAIALNPSYGWARHYYTLLLLMLDRTTDAVEQNREALALDPLSLPASATRGIILCQRGDYAGAMRDLRRALSLSDEHQLTLYYLGVLCAHVADDAEALTLLERAERQAPGFTGVPGALAYLYRRGGRPEGAESILLALQARSSDDRARANLAFAYGALGRYDDAFALLEHLRWDVPSLIELHADPLLASLRADGRYAMLKKLLGLSDREAPNGS